MQIFGQNIFGLQAEQDYVYSGEISYELDRLIKALFSVTSQDRLSDLSVILASNQSQLASIMVSSSPEAHSTIISISSDNPAHKASLSIE